MGGKVTGTVVARGGADGRGIDVEEVEGRGTFDM